MDRLCENELATAKSCTRPASVPRDTLPRVNNGLPGFGAFNTGFRGATTWQFLDMATKINSFVLDGGNNNSAYLADLNVKRARPSVDADRRQRESPVRRTRCWSDPPATSRPASA